MALLLLVGSLFDYFHFWHLLCALVTFTILKCEGHHGLVTSWLYGLGLMHWVCWVEMLSEWKSSRGGWEEEERQGKVGGEGRYKRRDTTNLAAGGMCPDHGIHTDSNVLPMCFYLPFNLRTCQ